jgi:hypothetical protein
MQNKGDSKKGGKHAGCDAGKMIDYNLNVQRGKGEWISMAQEKFWGFF